MPAQWLQAKWLEWARSKMTAHTLKPGCHPTSKLTITPMGAMTGNNLHNGHKRGGRLPGSQNSTTASQDITDALPPVSTASVLPVTRPPWPTDPSRWTSQLAILPWLLPSWSLELNMCLMLSFSPVPGFTSEDKGSNIGVPWPLHKEGSPVSPSGPRESQLTWQLPSPRLISRASHKST